MGFSNCAAVGCCVGLKAREPVLAIIGDGSVPMNCQELAWIQSSRVKVVVVDNSGYGIIRMTQDDFYGGRHLGSEFGTSNRLPSFSAASIARGFRLSAEEVSANDISEQVLEDFFESGVHVLVIKTPESDRVKVDFYE
jgi:acetolactate synthase-1/2/3 large subunit